MTDAKIENVKDATGEDTERLFREMEPTALFAQHLVQQGAINFASHLLENSARCTPAYIEQALAGLRVQAEIVRAESARRGEPIPFASDQVAKP